MKKLYVIRHAKSSWDYPDLEDFDRPLNERGCRDAPRIGKFLKDKNIQIDLMISSPAVRALSTAQLIAVHFKYPIQNIILEPSYYEFDDNGDLIIKRLTLIDNNVNSVAIYGHNETFECMIQRLTKGKVDEFPTCSAIALSYDINTWDSILGVFPDIDFFVTPKMLDN